MQCGTCCKICDPISIDDEDIQALAKHFKIPYQKAVRKYTRPYPGVTFMKALKHTNPCKFYDQIAHTCKVYDARPKMCRVYPFLSPHQQELPAIGIYDDCPGMLLTLQVFKQFADQNSEGLEHYQKYVKAHPEVEQLFNELLSRAVDHTVFGADTIADCKRIAEKLSPHLAAIRAIETSE